MNLQDQFALDLPTFVNPTEFGKLRVVDGRSISCVLDEDQRVPDPATGVYRSESTLYARTADLAALPVITQRMVIAGRQANVIHVEEALGMVTIKISWFES